MKINLLRIAGGYTFIELMVAITILGFLIAPLLGLFTGSFSSITAAGNKTAAVNLGREKMESLKAGGYEFVYDYYVSRETSPFTEENIPAWPRYRRTTEVAPLKLDQEEFPPGAELVHIKITVYWTDRGAESVEVLESTLGRR